MLMDVMADRFEGVPVLGQIAHWPVWHPSSPAVSGAIDHPLSVGEQVEIVTYNDGTSLATLPWWSEIYVRGHCWSGDHEIDNDVNGTSSLKYDTVADRLLSHGLKKIWSGMIKLYNCNSGSCTLGRQSFAAKYAQYMRFKKGYHLISYVGYFGSLDSYPDYEGAASHHKHKFSTRFEGTRFETEMKTKWCKVFF